MGLYLWRGYPKAGLCFDGMDLSEAFYYAPVEGAVPCAEDGMGGKGAPPLIQMSGRYRMRSCVEEWVQKTERYDTVLDDP